jgi:hypothetical protein
VLSRLFSANTHRITVIAYALAEDKHNSQKRVPAVGFPWSRKTDTVFTLKAWSNIPALAFDNTDPSGRWLYSSCIDGRTIQWDLHRRLEAATFQMGWCASAVSASMRPVYGSYGFTCACTDAESILHGAWGAIPLDTRAAYEMTHTEEQSSLQPKSIEPCFKDVSARSRCFTAKKRWGPTGVYASTTDDEVSESENEEMGNTETHQRRIKPRRQSKQPYCKIIDAEDTFVRIPKVILGGIH